MSLLQATVPTVRCLPSYVFIMYRRILWHIPVCRQYTIYHFEQLKTEANVWTVETVIRSSAQECGDAGTALLRTGYEWPTTIATIVHCCNDKDLCKTKIVDLKRK